MCLNSHMNPSSKREIENFNDSHYALISISSVTRIHVGRLSQKCKISTYNHLITCKM